MSAPHRSAVTSVVIDPPIDFDRSLHDQHIEQTAPLMRHDNRDVGRSRVDLLPWRNDVRHGVQIRTTEVTFMSTLADQFARMATGAMYDDLTPELIAARTRAVLATNAYNASYGRRQDEREELLRDVVGTVGSGANFEPTFRCEFGSNIHLGKRFFANFDCVMLDCAPITIGDDVMLAPKVGLYTAGHALDAAERAAGGCFARPINIGNAVWIGAGVSILPGVTICDGAVVGAGSVVTRDVPPCTVVAGNPARVLREITEADRTGFRPTH